MIKVFFKIFFRSFYCALAGINHTLRSQRNMQVHLVAAVLVVTVGLFLRFSQTEWISISFAIFFVLAAECFNTAMEAVVDLTTREMKPLARIAKDCAAGAVLLAALNSLVVAYFVIWPKLWLLFN